MFGWFTKKSEETSTQKLYRDVLSLRGSSLVQAGASLIDASDPNSCVMLTVAYVNLPPILAFTFRLATKNPGQNLPRDLEGFLRLSIENLSAKSDEIGNRRTHWFIQAGILMRAAEEAITVSDVALLANAWVRIARFCERLPYILESNVLWSDSEKSIFDIISKSKNKGYLCGESYVINHVAPRIILESEEVQRFFEEMKFFAHKTDGG